MVGMMIPSEGAAKNIAMVFAGLPVDGRRPILARFTVELQARRGLLSFSRGEKVAGTAG